MTQKTLLLMSGPSGAGKSYWAKNFGAKHKTEYISRDTVRFSMVGENEEYFSKEDDVFKEWIRQIQEALDNATDETYVIADATHLNEKSRNKTLDHLNLEDVEIWCVFANPGAETCLAHNEGREGRSYVPRSVIRRMCFQYEPPHSGERYPYANILEIKGVDNK